MQDVAHPVRLTSLYCSSMFLSSLILHNNTSSFFTRSVQLMLSMIIN